MDWSCDESQIMCHSHIKKTFKVTFEARDGKKTRTCFLSPKTVYNKERKVKKEKRKRSVQPNDISFNIVAHSGLIEEAFSGHCNDRFQAWFYLLNCFHFSTFSLFLYALGFQPALPISPEQYARGCSSHSQRGEKKASCCIKVCLFI